MPGAGAGAGGGRFRSLSSFTQLLVQTGRALDGSVKIKSTLGFCPMFPPTSPLPPPEGMRFVTLIPALGPCRASSPSPPGGEGGGLGAIPGGAGCHGGPAQDPHTRLAGGPGHPRAVPETALLPSTLLLARAWMGRRPKPPSLPVPSVCADEAASSKIRSVVCSPISPCAK